MGNGTYHDFLEKKDAFKAQIEPITSVDAQVYGKPSPYALSTFIDRTKLAFEESRAIRNMTDIGFSAFSGQRSQLERVRELETRREYLGETNIANEFLTGSIGEIAGRAYDPSFWIQLDVMSVVAGVTHTAARAGLASISSSRTLVKGGAFTAGLIAEGAVFTGSEQMLALIRNYYKELISSPLTLEKLGVEKAVHDFGTAMVGSLVMRTGAFSVSKAWNAARDSGITGTRNFTTKESFQKAKEYSKYREYVNDRDPTTQSHTQQTFYGEMTHKSKIQTTTHLWDSEMFADSAGNVHNGFQIIFPNIHPAAASVAGQLPVRNITIVERATIPEYSRLMKTNPADAVKEVSLLLKGADQERAFVAIQAVDPTAVNRALLKTLTRTQGQLKDFKVRFNDVTSKLKVSLKEVDGATLEGLKGDIRRISRELNRSEALAGEKVNAQKLLKELNKVSREEAEKTRALKEAKLEAGDLSKTGKRPQISDAVLWNEWGLVSLRKAIDRIRRSISDEAKVRKLIDTYIEYFESESAVTADAIIQQEEALQLGSGSYEARDLQYATEKWAISMDGDIPDMFNVQPSDFVGKGDVVPAYSDILTKFQALYSFEGVTGWIRTTGDLSNPATDRMHKKTETALLKGIDEFAKAAPDLETFYKPLFRTISNATTKRLSMRAISISPLAEAVHKIGIMRMKDIVKSEESNKRIIGAFFKTSRNVALNTEEKMLADGIREVANNIRQMQLTSGFNLGYIEDYLPIQFKDVGSLVKNGVTREQYVEFWMEGMDWERVDVAEEGRSEMIGKSFDSIINGDEISAIESKNPFKTEFGRASRSRVFHMKNAEVAYQAMRMFSESTNVIDAVTKHSNSVMNRLGMYRTLGADPYGMSEKILAIAKRRMVGKPLRGKKTIVENVLQPRAEFNSQGLEAGLNELTQRYSLYQEGTLFGKVIDGLSKAVITSKLGAIGRFYLEDTTRTVLQSLELGFMVKDLLRETVKPGGAPAKQTATLFGLMLDDCRQIYPSETYYTHIDKSFATFAEVIQVGSGGKFLTNRMKRVAAKNWYRNIASIIEKDFSDLSPAVEAMLAKHDFSPVDFEILKNTPFNVNVDGVKLFAPRDVFKLKSARERRAVIKLNEAMHDYIRQGVIESDKLSFAMYFGVQQGSQSQEARNSIQFLAKNLATFTGAPTSLSFLLSVSPNFGQRIVQELFWITLTGAGMNLLKEASKGRVHNFEDFNALDTFKFILEANKEGGAFGYSSEALLSIIIGGVSLMQDENGRDLKRAAGHILGSAGVDIVVDTIGNTSQLIANLMQGQNGKALENLIRYFPNFPGLELFLHRVVLNQLDDYSSSSVFADAIADYERRQQFAAERTKSLRF